MSKYRSDPVGQFGDRSNGGILNKAFYLTAIKLEQLPARTGTDRAAEIWIRAIPGFMESPRQDFWSFARALESAAGEDQASVHAALVEVGLDVSEPGR